MYIAQVTPRYYPHIGGVENVIKNISEQFVKMGHRVEVLTIDPTGTYSNTDNINGVMVRRFPQEGIYCYSSSLLEYIKNHANSYDIVHAHNLHTFIPHLTIKACRKINKTGIVISGHYHGQGKSFISNILLRFYRPIAKKILQYADNYVCVSNFEASLLTKHFNVADNKISIIYNGVAVEKIINTKNSKSCKKKGKNILIVSRLEKYKNIHLAIKAMLHLPDYYKLIIVGDGPYKKKLERLISNLNLLNRVKLLGSVESEKLFCEYKTCDIVLNFSRLEAFGITAIEGLVAGRPVLVNNKASLSELADKFNNIFPFDLEKQSSKSIAEKIHGLSGLYFCENTNILEQFKWGNVAKKTLSVYCKII